MAPLATGRERRSYGQVKISAGRGRLLAQNNEVSREADGLGLSDEEMERGASGEGRRRAGGGGGAARGAGFFRDGAAAGFFARADQARGKLRSLLLTAFQWVLLDRAVHEGAGMRRPEGGWAEGDFEAAGAEWARSAEGAGRGIRYRTRRLSVSGRAS
jgi:hypothetical protein